MVSPLVVVAAGVALVAIVAYFVLSGPSRVKLSKVEYKMFPLIEKIDVIPPEVGCHTMLFRFGLPSKNSTLDLPIGQHLSIKFTNEEKQLVARQYTPTTDENTKGHLDLIIKVYPKGQMGNYLKNLPIGSKVPFKGPLGSLEYKGQGKFVIKRKNETTGVSTMKTYDVKDIGMLAGGTGITPMLQIIRYISSNPQDQTKMSLIFGNQTEGDIMCRKELQDCAERNPNFKLWFMVDKDPGQHWRFGTGFITPTTIQQQLPAPGPNTLVLLCGPPPMMAIMKKHLAGLGYTDDMVFEY